MTEARKKMYDEYRKLGMSEEALAALIAFDDAVEKGDEEYAENTVSFREVRKKERAGQWN